MKLIYCIMLILLFGSCSNTETKLNDLSDYYRKMEIEVLNDAIEQLVDTSRYPFILENPETFKEIISDSNEYKEHLKDYAESLENYKEAKLNGYPCYVIDTLDVFPTKDLAERFKTDTVLVQVARNYPEALRKLMEIENKTHLDISKLNKQKYYIVTNPYVNGKFVFKGVSYRLSFTRIGFNDNFNEALVFYFENHLLPGGNHYLASFEKVGDFWKLSDKILVWHSD